MDLGEVPPGARAAARVLIFDANQRLLLLEAQEGSERWWLAPGGGLEPNESFEDAARREVAEELGFAVDLGPCVWWRHHRYMFNGREHDQYERLFVARSFTAGTRPCSPDSYVIGTRWWTLEELANSSDEFAPRRLPELIVNIAEGRYPVTPIDCGI